jgi:2-polyprenyl-3-methyl-5-hydroxy-6-metoxy-1,4-benzoquinol methylase
VRIGQSYYETSGYFEAGAEHLLDPGSRFQRYRAREVLRLCGPLTGARVVDLGCGWGTLSFPLAERAAEVVGVDFARAALRLCLERRSRADVGGARPPGFVQADARRTPLRAGRWDIVVTADLVEHLYAEDTLAVYREAFRLLRPGGRLVVWTPCPTHFLERLRAWRVLKPDPTHVDYKTLRRVVDELRSSGFEIVTARHAPSHLPVLKTAERVGQRWIRWLRRRVAVVARKPE